MPRLRRRRWTEGAEPRREVISKPLSGLRAGIRCVTCAGSHTPATGQSAGPLIRPFWDDPEPTFGSRGRNPVLEWGTPGSVRGVARVE